MNLEQFPASDTDDLIADIMTIAAEHATTDLHFLGDRLFFRAKNKMKPALEWARVTGKDGKLLPDFTVEALMKLIAAEERPAGVGGMSNSEYADRLRTRRTVMFHRRNYSFQLRVQLLETVVGPELVMRIQQKEAPQLADVLKAAPATLQFLTERPEGLVVVTGPMGSGKTTFAAGLAKAWAERGQHLVTNEDPVEYEIEAPKGLVSLISCDFRDKEKLHSMTNDLLRSDMDALFVGEVRSAEILNTCLEFAGMSEPVITTAHGGSFAHCLTRLMTIGAKIEGELETKVALARCLYAIVYVNLAYTKNGVPVPVIACLPCNNKDVSKIIAENSSTLFDKQLMKFTREANASSHPALISYEKAKKIAIQAGATEESVEKALPRLGVLGEND